MATKSIIAGHEVIYDTHSETWIYADTGEPITLRPCKHCGKEPVAIMVKIPADLSHTGEPFWKYAQIDACIAPMVEALQKAGIDMRGSCCGHGKGVGEIELQDGRMLLILPNALDYYLMNKP